MEDENILNDYIAEAKKKRSIFDQTASMHFKLSDIYHMWSVITDIIEIVFAVALGSVAFANLQQLSIIIGIVSSGLFAFTLIKQRLNLKEKSEQHRLAGKAYVNAKLDINTMLLKWNNEATVDEIADYLLNSFKYLGDVIQIPEKKFAKLKHYHQRKIEFSKYLDDHKSDSWFKCKREFRRKT